MSENNENMELGDNIKKWLCVSCRVCIGLIEDERIVRIKRRDLCVEIEGGNDKVSTICYRCGKCNTIDGRPPEPLKEGPQG